MSCPQCFSGHVNPGTPTGRWDTVHGLRTYIAEPTAGKQTLGVIVIIPDAFGVDFVNNQILADHYASAAQYLVYLPDFMDGQSVNKKPTTLIFCCPNHTYYCYCYPDADRLLFRQRSICSMHDQHGSYVG